MSKKVLSLVLALVMVLGTFGTAFAAAATTPTGNEKVDKLIELGLVQGYADGTYGLAQAITRAEMATMVVRALDLEAVANASMAFPSQFTDMNSANVLWARGYVNVAAGQGIVNGYPEGTFLPANNVTYAEAAAMLVRVLGGLTAAEEANAVWPVTYLAKAAQLGVFADVDGIVDYNAPATRENLFEMVFNTLMTGSDLLVANTIEGLVVENYRTESLAKDEVVVHVMKDQDAKNDKYDVEKGEEFKVVVTPELAEKGVDVETLLGKVVKVSYDKNDKVVGVEINNDYDYLVGELKYSAREIELDGEDYTVVKSESREASDERLYQVYQDNKDIDYKDLKDADYAKVTVRNGKVLFIDAFNFDDVAPVAEVKNDGETIYILDDARDGAEKKLSFKAKSSYVLAMADGVASYATLEDIEAMDVIHYNTTTKTIFVVLDAAVEGTYEKYRSATDSVDIYVDGEAYNALFEVPYSAVYTTDGEEFESLTKLNVKANLRAVQDEEVTLLLDMNGKVQYVGAEIVDPSFLGMVVDVIRGEVRLAKADGTSSDLTATFDSELNGTGDTKLKNLSELNFADLVTVEVDGDEIVELKVEKTTGDDQEGPLTKITDDYITVNGSRVYIGSKTALFVVDEANETIVGMDIDTILDKYEDDYAVSLDKKVVVYDKDNKDGKIDAIVFYNLDKLSSSTKKITVKVNEIYDTKAGYLLETEDEDGVESNHLLTKDVDKDLVAEGDIVELTVTKDDAEKVVSGGIKVLIAADAPAFLVVDIVGNVATLRDVNGLELDYLVLKSAIQFGDFGVDEYISFDVDENTDIYLLEVRGKADFGSFTIEASDDSADYLDDAKSVLFSKNYEGTEKTLADLIGVEFKVKGEIVAPNTAYYTPALVFKITNGTDTYFYTYWGTDAYPAGGHFGTSTLNAFYEPTITTELASNTIVAGKTYADVANFEVVEIQVREQHGANGGNLTTFLEFID